MTILYMGSSQNFHVNFCWSAIFGGFKGVSSSFGTDFDNSEMASPEFGEGAQTQPWQFVRDRAPAAGHLRAIRVCFLAHTHSHVSNGHTYASISHHVYIFIYIYIYIHTSVYIHTCIHVCAHVPLFG